MKSLLEYSFKSVRYKSNQLSYYNIQTEEEQNIYDKIVEKSRYKIRLALRKQKTILIILFEKIWN